MANRRRSCPRPTRKPCSASRHRRTRPPAAERGGGHVPTINTYLGWAHGSYLLTAILDPDGDGTIYITGLPLSSLHDLLRDVALVEAAVFGAVLLLAGVLGTLWVRFSLRPLRRVAVTASQVTELPLESGEVSLPAGVPDTDPATETGQVGIAFNRMLGHVETALRRRAASESRLRRFAADASHELRTPLAAIRGYAELALRHPGDSPETVTHALGRVLSESTRMSVLVDDLLLLARLDAGRPLSSEPVDMTRLAIDATSDAQVARPGHRWVLELPDDPELVLGDEHRLRQVLGNLLSNAGRHTPDGTTVTVRVSGALPAGEPGSGTESVSHGTLPPAPRLVISVTDNGPGIPAALLPDLFERFTRADTLPLARHQRLVDRARARDRRRRGHRPSRRGAGDQPARHDPLHDRARRARGDVRAGRAGADGQEVAHSGVVTGSVAAASARAAAEPGAAWTARPCSGPRRISEPHEDRAAQEDPGAPPERGRVAVDQRQLRQRRGRLAVRAVAGQVADRRAGRDGVEQRGADRAAELLAGVDGRRGDARVLRRARRRCRC